MQPHPQGKLHFFLLGKIENLHALMFLENVLPDRLHHHPHYIVENEEVCVKPLKELRALCRCKAWLLLYLDAGCYPRMGFFSTMIRGSISLLTTGPRVAVSNVSGPSSDPARNSGEPYGDLKLVLLHDL